MGHNLMHLASQGRAYSAGRPWSADEGEAVKMLIDERHLGRIRAADWVRNGILTLEAFDKATKKEFVPKTMDQAHEEAEKALKERGKKAVTSSKKSSKKGK